MHSEATAMTHQDGGGKFRLRIRSLLSRVG
jgi:hypothetical protein